MIRLEQLDVVFDKTVALDHVDVRIDPGLVGLFGPNGSGKSTLLRVLAGRLAPTAGTALIDGRPCHPADEELRARLGYSGHETGLYPNLTVEENLDLFALVTGAEKSRVGHVMTDLDLADRAGVRVRSLSAGQKRRASVARALVGDPDVLLLDEPYANVDDDAAAIITRAIVSWWGPGRVGVVATHGAKRVKPYASASLVLRRGSLAAYRSAEP